MLGHDITVITTKKCFTNEMKLNLPCENFKVLSVPYFSIAHNGYNLLKTLTGVIDSKSKRVLSTAGGGKINANKSFSKLKKIIFEIKNYFGIFVNDRIPDATDMWIIPAIKKVEAVHKKQKIDWVVSSYAPPASHLVAGFFVKKYGINWVADYRDLWLENHVWIGKWPFTVLEQYLEKKYVGNHADLISTVSQPLADVLEKKFSVPAHVIENGYDEDDYDKKFCPYFKSIKKRIIYTGTIHKEKTNPSPLFEAIALMAEKMRNNHSINIMSDFEVLFFGSQSDWLDSLIKKYKVENWVKYMGRVNRASALSIQNQADILLFLEWENGSFDGILTGKLFEYLAMKKPILGIGVTSKTSAGALMEEAGVGIAVGNDIEKIFSILEKFVATGIPFDIQIKKDVIDRYTRKKQAEKMLELMGTFGG